MPTIVAEHRPAHRRDQRGERPRLVVIGVGPLGPRRRAARRTRSLGRRAEQFLGGDAEPFEVLPGQVEPAVLRVLADVAEDVGQLQRDPARLGQRLGPAALRAVAPDVQAAEPDGRGDVVAVAVQVVERRERPRVRGPSPRRRSPRRGIARGSRAARPSPPGRRGPARRGRRPPSSARWTSRRHAIEDCRRRSRPGAGSSARSSVCRMKA